MYLKCILNFIQWNEGFFSILINISNIGVDTFLLLSGLLVTNSFLRQIDRNGRVNVLKTYLHRYLRITPVVAILVLMLLTFFKFFGDGPYHTFMVNFHLPNCENYWWSALLHVQNYVNPTNVVSIEGNLWNLKTLLIPLIIPVSNTFLVLVGGHAIVLDKSCSAFSAIFPWTKVFVVNFGSCATHNGMYFHGSVLEWVYSISFTDEPRVRRSIHSTHLRCNSCPCWALADRSWTWVYSVQDQEWTSEIKSSNFWNFAIQRFHNNFNNFQILSSTLWVLAISAILTVLLLFHPLQQFQENTTTNLQNAFYLAFFRNIFALSVGWIIFGCQNGTGSVINWLLSRPIWQPFARMGLSVYMTHVIVQVIMLASLKQPWYFGDMEILHSVCGDFVVTIMVSTVLYLIIEAPVLLIEKFCYDKRHKMKKKTNDGTDLGLTNLKWYQRFL